MARVIKELVPTMIKDTIKEFVPNMINISLQPVIKRLDGIDLTLKEYGERIAQLENKQP